MTDDYRRQYAKAMGDTEAFLRNIAADPYDAVRLHAFGDYLDDRGYHALAHEIHRHVNDGDTNNWWPFVGTEHTDQFHHPDANSAAGITPIGRYGDFDVYHHTEGGAGQTPRHVVTFAPRGVRNRLRFHVEVEPNEGEVTDGMLGFLGRLGATHPHLSERLLQSVIEKADGRDEF